MALEEIEVEGLEPIAAKRVVKAIIECVFDNEFRI
jgi:hypothetical protein